MTEEVQLRLADLRTAAETFRRSARRVDVSTSEAAAALDGLLPLLAADPTLASRYTQLRGSLPTWAATLNTLADKLENAANDIEHAHHSRFTLPPLRLDLPPGLARSTGTGLALAAGIAPTSLIGSAGQGPLPTEGVYVSQRNTALYTQWNMLQQQSTQQETALTNLHGERATVAKDLTALKNRLHSYDPQANLEAVPRVREMQAQLNRLDADIASGQQQLTDLHGQLERVQERLARVSPHPGADLTAIAALEGAHSPAWLHDNTFDCVRHIVDKMPVPPALATNAHEWVANAAALPQYGIQTGDVPLVGSVMVLQPEHPYADDVFGHLFYVERVENGAVWVTDNFHPDVPVRLSAITDVTSGPGITYLYFPWQTAG